MGAIPWEFKSPPEHNLFKQLKKQGKPKILLFDSYIQAIKNSVGSNLFRNLYLEIAGKKIDVLEDGNLSCAKFVSSILYMHKLINDMHTTVAGTIADLGKDGWFEIKKPRPGAILVWETKQFRGGNPHKHLGFYINNDQAISNRYDKRHPLKHHWTFGIKNDQPIRKIEQIFWNNKLNTK